MYLRAMQKTFILHSKKIIVKNILKGKVNYLQFFNEKKLLVESKTALMPNQLDLSQVENILT